MSVAAYVRVSTEEQALQGVSLSAQKAKIEAYCKMKGLSLSQVFCEEGVSGAKPLKDRPQGSILLKEIEAGHLQHLIVAKLDRLSRSMIHTVGFVDRLGKLGVELHILDLDIDTSTPIGRMVFYIIAALADMEREMIRDRTRTALQHKKAKGERIGNVPYGWRLKVEGPQIEKDPDEQRALCYMKHLREVEGLSYRKICQELALEGFKPRGKRWNPGSVKRILDRPEQKEVQRLEPLDPARVLKELRAMGGAQPLRALSQREGLSDRMALRAALCTLVDSGEVIQYQPQRGGESLYQALLNPA